MQVELSGKARIRRLGLDAGGFVGCEIEQIETWDFKLIYVFFEGIDNLLTLMRIFPFDITANFCWPVSSRTRVCIAGVKALLEDFARGWIEDPKRELISILSVWS